MTLCEAANLSAFLPVTIFFLNTAYLPCFYRKGNTVTFLLKTLKFRSFAALLTMQPESWEHTHRKPGRNAF